MDKYLGLGLDDGMADLVGTVLPDVTFFGIGFPYLGLCDLSPIGFLLLLH